jgi:DNA-directed RNA polymerase subunit K/omega
MSDIEDYLSGDDSDSVQSLESEEKEVKKPMMMIKKPLVATSTDLLEPDIDSSSELVDDLDDDDDLILDDDDDDLVLDDDDSDDEEEDEEDDDYYDEQEGGAPSKKKPKKNAPNATNNASLASAANALKKAAAQQQPISNMMMDSDDEEDEGDENYLQKFDQEIKRDYVSHHHPECIIHNYEEVKILSEVVRDSHNIIIDPFHKTIPFLTKYEKARILGQRAKQIEAGSKPFVKVPENIIDGYIIAELELREKRIPFILRRPLPSGGCEYWNLRDLEIINL